MKTLRFLLFAWAALSGVFFQACTASLPSRQLLSVTVSPSSATAPGSPRGQVQFVATGYYNIAPSTVTPLPATWGANIPQKVATVDQSGLATCVQGASGSTTVEAWVELSNPGPICNVMDAQGRVVCGSIGGTAELTCP